MQEKQTLYFVFFRDVAQLNFARASIAGPDIA